MRCCLLFLALVLLLQVQVAVRGDEETRPILTSLDEARRLAAEEGKLILVYLDPGWKDGGPTDAGKSLFDSVLHKAARQVLVVRLPAGIEDPESETVRRRYALWHDLSGAVVIDDASFDRVLRLLERPPAPTDALRELMRDRRD